MNDRPILFSGSMVRALLDGRKTQTRRVLTPAPFIDRMGNFCAPDRRGVIWNWGQHTDGTPCTRNYTAERIRFAVGDRLWVRETWSHTGDGVFEISQARIAPTGRVIFAATPAPDAPHAKYWPSIHMPREFSRLTLAVTEVRVERLQDISEADAIAEGPGFVGKVTREVCESATAHRLGLGPRWRNARDWYADLWDSLNAKRGYGWDTNPWVVALTFTVHHQNIDALGAKEAA